MGIKIFKKKKIIKNKETSLNLNNLISSKTLLINIHKGEFKNNSKMELKFV